MRHLLIVFAIALGTAPVSADEPVKPWQFNPASLQPFWRSSTMQGESVLLIKDDPAKPPHAAVLFQPTKVLAVTSSSGEVTYEEGRDYVCSRDTREITLPAGSRIPFKTPQDLRRRAKSQRHALTHRDGNGEILFGGGHEYHDMQTLITYKHAPVQWPGRLPTFAGGQLPRTLKKLTEKQPLSIALLGDSISTGCNASGWAKTAPFQPPYQDLLVMNLKAVYGAKVSLTNFSVGGTSAAWGLKTIPKVIEVKPDLVILAFGMNDSVGRPPAQYQADIRGMIEAVHKALPDTEIILVATMQGNADWVTLKQPLFPQYRDALAQLCGPGVALADMTSIWAELLRHKKDWDMTGNGVNHPNDFGHRIYAQVLSTLLIEDR
ncbi:MAG: SGNH/GDSL hydrolase family protein [Thermoguttaceae bacterium]